ncbi:hypothetical protein TELCIR_20472, partial [Teladorsagia circumcincta]
MQQSFQDAMAIVARFGKPTYFLTMTCNPQWKEIQENLFTGQTPSDRPDLTSRVFYAKLTELCTDLFKKHVLGEVQAYVYVVEFQKRGLPHCHMLLIMKEGWKVRTPEECDRAVIAEIPNPETEQELYGAITSYMIHRQCGPADPQSPCMQSGFCSKRFPKPLRHQTSVEPDGYPLYRRRNLFPAEINGVPYSDEWVVPTNPYLILKYNCHINMEICGMISAVKYLYKYIYKGPDRANINIESVVSMSDDYIHQGLDVELAVSLAYFDVSDRMSLLGKDFTRIVTPPTRERPLPPNLPTDYIAHERNGLRQYETLNTMQKAAADSILSALDGNGSKYIYVDGPGGSGKTYLYNTVYNIAVGRRYQVLCVACTGIAANLLPGGRT